MTRRLLAIVTVLSMVVFSTILSLGAVQPASAHAPGSHGAASNRRFDMLSYICEPPLCFPIPSTLWVEGQMYNANQWYCTSTCREMLQDVRITFRDTTNPAGVDYGIGFTASIVTVGSMGPYLTLWPNQPPGYSTLQCVFIGPPGSIPDYCFWGRPDWLLNIGNNARLEWKPYPSGAWFVVSGATSFEYLRW